MTTTSGGDLRERDESRTHLVWTLHRNGRQTSCVVTELASGGFEVALQRSDGGPSSIHRYAHCDDAVAEAQRLATNYIVHGWAFHRETR